jgi:hypothetical protein
VICQDVYIGQGLAEVVNMMKKPNVPLYLIVLCPSPEVVAQREAARDKTGYGTWIPVELDRILRSETPRLGLWLDTSALSVEETVDSILAQLDEAVV